MIETVLTHFMGRAVLAIMGLSVLSGPLGCFLLWRRMAFFGDALGHAALLGVVVGVASHMDPTLSVLLICLIVSLILSIALQSTRLPSDASLGMLSYTSLSLGLILLSFMSKIRFDPSSILFGDILAVSTSDLVWIYGAVVVGGLFLIWQWRNLLLLTIDVDLAQIAGISLKKLQILFMVLMSLTVAIGLKSVGALLIPAILIFPAATASRWAYTPEQMVGLAAGLSLASSLCGVAFSFWADTPTGPTLVLCHATVFFISQIAAKFTESRLEVKKFS